MILPTSMAESDLTERAQLLFKALVERYIRDGQPVGSRTLARDSGLRLSPATIRNVMADLEELGLIASPHTSAGRIPTVQGYRFFVDSLLTIKPLDEREVSSLAQSIQLPSKAIYEPKQLLTNASSLLSSITAMAGVVMLPRRDLQALRQVEFLPLSERRVLVILVINNQEVQNRVIETSRDYSASELQEAANYLNSHFAGHDLRTVRSELLQEMEEAQQQMNKLMIATIEMAEKAFDQGAANDGGDFLMAGQTNLMNYSEMSDMDRLRQLFEAFNEKRDILHLLDQSLDAEGIQIFIGDESGREVLESCSVVTAPYTIEGQLVGVLGVIGPTRMRYDRVIPIVDVTAKLIGSALNQPR